MNAAYRTLRPRDENHGVLLFWNDFLKCRWKTA